MTQQPRTPTTGAGKRFAFELNIPGDAGPILAIEAEARADLLAQIEKAVRLLEIIDAPVDRRHDALVTKEVWLDVIRPEIKALRAAIRSAAPVEPT